MKVIVFAVWMNLIHYDYGVILLSRKAKLTFREAQKLLNEKLVKIEIGALQ